MDFSQKIDREELREVFRRPFDADKWKTLLIEVFGANKLYEQPKPRELDNGENAKVEGFDLGEIITSDKYTIGLFQFEIKSGHNIPMNRVGLRGLVEKEIKYFYDAALGVYYNESQWRLSFICDMQGEKTSPKRFTYVFGDPGQSYRTPISRFELIKSKGVSKDIIHEAFSVEALNKEFYGFIAKRFYELVGATTGQGKNKTEHKRIMRLPGEQDTIIYQEFAVRLIGRTVFCWFLKEKKSGGEIPLLPAELLSSKSLDMYDDYYHTVLERIFFQTLNTPIKDRVEGLPAGCELIPFLNGGLFDYRPHDFYAPEENGLSKHRNELEIPDGWFAALFAELEQYNFTIDENSPDDIEVSVDPEMLGRIFENLLAEIDPDSGETARKATGSFYTPREIVDYMAVESLVYYLNRKTGIDRDDLYPLFKSTGTAEFSAQQRDKLLVALDELKILDPACGSGAFPMGVLAKITGALQILDKDAVWWKQRQIQRIDNAKVRQEMQEKLDTATVEYARKIGIIQNTLYGVDIQPIAAEISKLRCFLTLIVDENVDDSKPNRGVDPLPNLEFKFITANSLMKLPPANIFGKGAIEDIERLRQLRINYLQSYGKSKSRIKDEFREIQKKIYDDQAGNSMLDTRSREYKISRWNPFSDEKSDWFDPEWMFGVTGGFDIVIANPPYGAKFNITDKKYFKNNYLYQDYQPESYLLFIEKGLLMLASKGVLSYIIPNTWLKNLKTRKIRNYIFSNMAVKDIVHFIDPVFEAIVDTEVIILHNDYREGNKINIQVREKGRIATWQVPQTKFSNHNGNPINIFDNDNVSFIREKFDSLAKLETLCKITQGAKPFQVEKGNPKQTREIVNSKCYVSTERDNDSFVPLLRGSLMNKYVILWNQNYWISFGDWPAEPRYSANYDAVEKIIVRQTGDSIIATLDTNQFIVRDNLYTIVPINNSVSLKLILGIINSSLINWYYQNILNSEKGEALAQVKRGHLALLPIRFDDQNITTDIADKVEAIIKAKKVSPIADTSTLEAEIDRMVYDLYGLTQEEIEIIEK